VFYREDLVWEKFWCLRLYREDLVLERFWCLRPIVCVLQRRLGLGEVLVFKAYCLCFTEKTWSWRGFGV
jgi:hypothetical protein